MPVNVEHARKPAAEAVCEEADAVASDGPAPPNRKQLALFFKVLSSSGSLRHTEPFAILKLSI
jgi:hypothetical protein